MHGRGVLTTAECVYAGESKGGTFDGYGERVWGDGRFYRGEEGGGREGRRKREGKKGVELIYCEKEEVCFDNCDIMFFSPHFYSLSLSFSHTFTHIHTHTSFSLSLSLTHTQLLHTHIDPGTWRKGVMHGYGVSAMSVSPDGKNEIYAGSFSNGHPDGDGVWVWVDGSYYMGEWKVGKRHGQGRHVFADGSSYEGEWKDDKFHGFGCHEWSDGSRLEGDFRADFIHGLGACVLSVCVVCVCVCDSAVNPCVRWCVTALV